MASLEGGTRTEPAKPRNGAMREMKVDLAVDQLQIGRRQHRPNSSRKAQLMKADVTRVRAAWPAFQD